MATAFCSVPDNQWTAMGKVVRTVSPVFKPRTAINPPAVAPAQHMTKEPGEYLARYVSNCVGCHTPRDQTTFAATGPEFSGGFELQANPEPGVDPNSWYRTPNLTPKAGSALRAIYEFLHTLPPSDGPAGDPTVHKN